MKVQKTSRSHAKIASPVSRLPTPATSSTTSWTNSSSSFSSSSPTWNDSFSYPISEVDELDGLLQKFKTMSRVSKRTRRSLRTNRPQMLQNTAIPRLRNSSWPFSLNDPRKSISADVFITGLVEFFYQRKPVSIQSLEALRLVLRRQFPYHDAFDRILSTKRKALILQSDSIDKIMNSIAQIYAGNSVFDLQKQNEIVFCAWTTLVQYACTKRILRNEQLPILAAVATILQAKLMDEADINIEILLKKTGLKAFSADEIKVWEIRVSSAVQFKLLYPTPHVILFLLFDNLDAFVPVPLTFKLICGLVLDNLLLSGAFRKIISEEPERFNRIGSLVFGILLEVMAYFYVERSLGSLSKRHLVLVLLSTLDEQVRELLLWPSFDFNVPEDILSNSQVQLVCAAITEVRSVALGGQSCNLL